MLMCHPPGSFFSQDGFRYEIGVYRAQPAQGFSARERNVLEEISPLLLPMLEKHLHALDPGAGVMA